ncbi:MAG: BrnA antitoxin family protein [Anaerolineae bacterium]|uniref:BrnA antitoxin family protein n=1 Tax=Candidatus Amarolinea dominans TaxID=3140696 RepID=UPI001D8D9441|nr:BrnA antitoxin family protein [Anaerolineae bacterium]MBK7199587.1 BrnA antitoxin family protein [Anaerolineae bacterium]
MNNVSISKESLTDWERFDALQDEDIDLSDAPEITPELFAKAVVRRGLKPPPSKQQITIRLDEDVLGWFRAQGEGYQVRINSLLRAYMEAHQTSQTAS